MTELLHTLRGRRVRGIAAFSSRSMALSLEGEPRAYLWLHLERKEAWWAIAEAMPIPPDPRGSPFDALAAPMRGARIADAAAIGDRGGFSLRLTPRGGKSSALILALDTAGPRTNLTLHAEPSEQVLWAFHREEAPPEGATERRPAERKPAERRPAELPAGYRPPVAREAITPTERDQLRERIEGAFRGEFDAELRRTIAAAERTLERRLRGAEEDKRRARAMQEDRRRAEILLANFGRIQRGASRVDLPDPFADSQRATVEISLDPALSPDENAARLFQRAKKGERGERLAEERLIATRKSLAGLADVRRELPLRSPKEALAFLQSFLSGVKLDFSARGDERETRLGRQAAVAPRAGRPGRGPTGARQSIRPRTFVTSDGWEVWVGRNNADNDRITHRLSNPHDLWFHVVGVPGSHVILRRPTRNAAPKPNTIVEAAQIAAYFSKARKLTRVPVIYTERKFVTRPRRAKPGLALCSREREILVRPRKPGDTAGKSEADREVSG